MPGKSIYGMRVELRLAMLILLVAIASGCATVHPDINPEKGFRDIAWGTPMTDMADITLLDKGGGRWKWGVRNLDQLNIGEVDVDSITYIFIDHSFAGIDATFGGYARFDQLIGKLEKTMGQPAVVNRNLNIVTWKQNGSTVMLRFYRRKNFGTLKYMNDKLAAQ